VMFLVADLNVDSLIWRAVMAAQRWRSCDDSREHSSSTAAFRPVRGRRRPRRVSDGMAIALRQCDWQRGAMVPMPAWWRDLSQIFVMKELRLWMTKRRPAFPLHPPFSGKDLYCGSSLWSGCVSCRHCYSSRYTCKLGRVAVWLLAMCVSAVLY
jgi:hypothetical protein